MQDVPELFREALARRKTRTAAIGWPVSVFPSVDGIAFIPGLILPIEFRVEAESLHLEVEAADPVVNPDWLREIRRLANGKESDLLERLFPEGEETDLGAVSNRMRYLLATVGGGSLRPGELASELSQNGKGLRNAAGLFLPEESSFTKAAADDLDAMRSWSAEARKQCALDALLSGTAGNQVLSVVPFLPAGADALLTDSQLDAAQSALNGPLTVIQGPPGTGKSQVILALIVSAVLSGRSVLFAAKNHQAIDEVERRLADIVSNAPLLTRARSADGERDASFLDALAAIARGDTRALNGENVEADQSALLERAGTIENARRKAKERERLNLALSELIDRLPAGDYKIERDPSIKLSAWLRRALSLGLWRKPDLAKSLEKQATLRQIKTRITEIHEQLAELPKTDDSMAFDAAALHSHAKSVADYLPKFAEFITLPDQAAWRNLVERARETEFIKTTARRLGAEDARAILRHRPVWAVSTLAAPARMPLVPGLFDYVIFDEASQCDIASALPLFARARKAVVVGDPLQLRFVPQLGNGSEHALMDAAGLPKAGRAMIAQSINSLFDFCETRPAAARKFLSDQFRSAPPIVGYLNADFYAGKLASRRDNESFRPPNGYKPGLDWQDVQGHAQRENGGTINKAEARHIADAARKLAEDPTFAGSVGILSPFNSQIAEIQTRLEETLLPAHREKLGLRVATIDKFQGGEADVIFFSLVLSASAPKSTWTFLQKERRRLNVAVSRARALCIVVGDLSYARGCGIRHIESLAKHATTPWTPYRPPEFDSDWERRLDVAMRGRGLQPIPQYPVGTRYLDFALDPDGVKLDVEVDGRRWHTDANGERKIADRLRDTELRSRGWKVCRFWVHELAQDMEQCLDRIESELGRR